MDSGDTSRTVEQGSTVGSRTIERAGPQVRQAAAAARQELLKLAAARFGAPVEKLTVQNGVIGVAGNAAQKVSYGQLVGGKKFNVRITATGNGWDMKVAPEVKKIQGLQDQAAMKRFIPPSSPANMFTYDLFGYDPRASFARRSSTPRR
jgi:CO/xanthine dehydrogenase Mo-binding subunit